MQQEIDPISEKEIEEIDSFDALYEGKMDEEEYFLLQARFELDEDLKQRYVIYKMMRREIEQDALTYTTMKAHFRQLDKSIKMKKRAIVIVIGSVFLLAGLLISIPMLQDNPSAIYKQYADTESGLSLRMNQQTNSVFDQAMIHLAKSDFSSAKQILEGIPKNDTATYYVGYCNERLGLDKQAINLYKTLADSESKYIKDKAIFRLGLLYLKSDIPSAKIQLQQMSEDESNPYQPIALEILLLLDK